MSFTIEIAAAFGFRDRILGVDGDARRETIARFDGVAFLENAYWRGWNEADH